MSRRKTSPRILVVPPILRIFVVLLAVSGCQHGASGPGGGDTAAGDCPLATGLRLPEDSGALAAPEFAAETARLNADTLSGRSLDELHTIYIRCLRPRLAPAGERG